MNDFKQNQTIVNSHTHSHIHRRIQPSCWSNNTYRVGQLNRIKYRVFISFLGNPLMLYALLLFFLLRHFFSFKWNSANRFHLFQHANTTKMRTRLRVWSNEYKKMKLCGSITFFFFSVWMRCLLTSSSSLSCVDAHYMYIAWANTFFFLSFFLLLIGIIKKNTRNSNGQRRYNIFGSVRSE